MYSIAAVIKELSWLTRLLWFQSDTKSATSMFVILKCCIEAWSLPPADWGSASVTRSVAVIGCPCEGARGRETQRCHWPSPVSGRGLAGWRWGVFLLRSASFFSMSSAETDIRFPPRRHRTNPAPSARQGAPFPGWRAARRPGLSLRSSAARLAPPAPGFSPSARGGERCLEDRAASLAHTHACTPCGLEGSCTGWICEWWSCTFVD